MYNSLLDLWKDVCFKYKDLTAFENENGEKITYINAYKKMCFLSKKFNELGLERSNHVSIFAKNSIDWLIIEQAIICNGGVCVAKSPEVSVNELNFVFTQSDSTILIIDNSSILKSFLETDKDFLSKIKFVLILEDENKTLEASNVYYLNELLLDFSTENEYNIDLIQYPNDIAYISYTSGTSSFPKGVMLKNSSMAFLLTRLCEYKKATANNKALCTCHISSMGWKAECLCYWAMGCSILFVQYNNFYDTIEKIKPTYFQIPPKILQTIYLKLQNKLDNKNKFYKLWYKILYSISKKILQIQHLFIEKNIIYNITQPLLNFLDLIFFKKFRCMMFNQNVLFDVGSAPLSNKLEDFYRIIGIKVTQSYGSTETTGIAISNTVESQRKNPYTVGIPFDGVQLKIVNPETFEELENSQTGLILIKGPIIFDGYYKNNSETNKSILENGYLNTGDLGFVNNKGYLKILSRYDDVLVLSNGYNIYTRLLENELKDSEYINQIVIIGHSKPYLCALIVINITKYQDWCIQNKEKNENINNNIKFKEFLLEHINSKIQRKQNFRYYEKLKNIYLITDDFTIENGLLAANTMKIIYKKVYEKYQIQIDNMYKGAI